MGFLDLFRKKKEEKIIEIENIRFEEVNSWIENKTQTLAKDKEVFIKAVKSRINQLNNELEQGIEGLKNINWDKIKTEDRIKNIVRENLKNYIMCLQQLNLELINLDKIERVNINSVFINFDKRTGKNYQKSTFLIGKELELINESVGNFFKDLDKLQEENKTLLDHVEIISNIKRTQKELDNKSSLIFEVNNEIELIHNKIDSLQLRIKKNNNSIEEIKKSKEFQEWQIENENYANSKNKLNSMIIDLRRIIDLKSLAKAWHKNETEMKIIRSYRENFEKAFNEDKEKVLKNIITSLNNKDLIHKSIQEIFDLKLKIKETILEKSLTSNLDEDIKKYDSILFGYNRIGHDILQSFKKLKKKFLVVDYNPETILELSKKGIECRYGDVDDDEFLSELNLTETKMIVSTIPDFEANLLLIHKIRESNKKTIIIVISHDIEEANIL